MPVHQLLYEIHVHVHTCTLSVSFFYCCGYDIFTDYNCLMLLDPFSVFLHRCRYFKGDCHNEVALNKLRWDEFAYYDNV